MAPAIGKYTLRRASLVPWGSLSERRYLVPLSRTANYPPCIFPFSQATTSHTWSLAFFSPSRSDGAEAASLPVLVLSRTDRPIASAKECDSTCIVDLCIPQLHIIPSGEASRAAFPASELDVPGASVPHPLVLHAQRLLSYALRPKRLDSWMVDLMFIACRPSLSALSTCRQIRQH